MALTVNSVFQDHYDRWDREQRAMKHMRQKQLAMMDAYGMVDGRIDAMNYQTQKPDHKAEDKKPDTEPPSTRQEPVSTNRSKKLLLI